jgi:polynucleotide 5'-hydroxyl-kinase GRC3/NOL9
MVFIGATSPEGHLLATTVGVWRLVEEARSAGSEVLLVDTSGLVYGGAARELKFQKIRLLRPDYLVALQRGGEIEHLLLPHERSGVRVVRLLVSDQALRHSREQRQAFRQRRFREYFRGAVPQEISLDRVVIYGLPLGTGNRMDFRELNRLSRMLDAIVIYGERSPDILFLVVEGGCGRDRIFSVKEEFGVREVLVVERADLPSLLLGLNDSRQFTLGLGILQEIDFRAGRLRVVTPLPHLGEVSQVAFGSLRVDPSGTELGKV